MIKVKIIKTGEVKTVTKGEAHGLIDSGVAKLYKEEYKTTSMQPSLDKGKYKIK